MEMIGKKFYDKGYRGTFDIDFAAGIDGNLYALESNARMTGGTHAHSVISYLGLDQKSVYVLSNDSLCYGDLVRKVDEILTLLSELLYPINEEKRGVIVSFISKNRPIIGIIIIEKNKEYARFLINRARDCLAMY